MNTNQPFHIAHQEQVKKRVQDLKKRSDDIKSRLAPILKKLWNPERELAVIQKLDVFDDLKIRFPNFIEAILLFEANAIALSKLGLPFESPPILLTGEPGLGKTLFVSELAKLIELPYFELSMATVTASFAISGGSLQWSEGTVGFIAESLAESKYGNPLMVIDEIDKCGESKYSPMSPFYSLLESHSAQRFKDEALEIELNASRIIWVATANYKELVPQPILSRMKVIDIKRPDLTQIQNVVMSIYSNLRSSKPYGKLLNPEMDKNAMSLLITKSPREAKLAIDEACLKAICENRSNILPQDLPIVRKETYHVGFI